MAKHTATDKQGRSVTMDDKWGEHLKRLEDDGHVDGEGYGERKAATYPGYDQDAARRYPVDSSDPDWIGVDHPVAQAPDPDPLP